MRIHLEQLKKGPFVYNVEFAPAFLTADSSLEEDYHFGPATGCITFRRLHDEILAQGQLDMQVGGRCARCLQETHVDLHVPIHLYYWPESNNKGSKIEDIEPDEPDFSLYAGEEIEPDEDLREALMVEVPERLLCNDACQGLCPSCGADLNKQPCACDSPEEKRPTSNWKNQLANIREQMD